MQVSAGNIATRPTESCKLSQKSGNIRGLVLARREPGQPSCNQEISAKRRGTAPQRFPFPSCIVLLPTTQQMHPLHPVVDIITFVVYKDEGIDWQGCAGTAEVQIYRGKTKDHNYHSTISRTTCLSNRTSGGQEGLRLDTQLDSTLLLLPFGAKHFDRSC